MSVQVRRIRINDGDGLHAAIDEVARERKYLALSVAPPIEQVRAFVKRNVENGYPQVVAVTNAGVVGWCNVPPASRMVSSHVGELFIGLLPQFRGRGFGKALLENGLQAADAFGFERVELGVFASNRGAIAMYEKAGFVREGIKRRGIKLDDVYHDEIIMARLRTS